MRVPKTALGEAVLEQAALRKAGVAGIRSRVVAADIAIMARISAADAAWPEGNEVLRGTRDSRRGNGTSAVGRSLRARLLPATLVTVLAIAMPATPRRAARRPHLLSEAARPAATPSHRRL